MEIEATGVKNLSVPGFLLRGLLVLVAIPPVLLVFSLFGLFPWSGVNCWQSDVDISSGRIRQTRYLLWEWLLFASSPSGC